MSSSRASFEQVEVIIEFMSKHSSLALGLNKSLEDRFHSKGLWQQIASKLNSIPGARKTPKGWSKYWADKKCNVRKLAMMHNNGTGEVPDGFSPLDKQILNIVGQRDKRIAFNRFKAPVKKEAEGDDDTYSDEREVEYGRVDKPIEFVGRPMDGEDERHAALMDKMLQIMSEQSCALTKIAEATQMNARALSELADASQQRSDALDRLAGSVARLADSFGDARSTIESIHSTVQRAFPDPMI